MDPIEPRASKAAVAVEQLRRERIETMLALMPIPDDQCRRRVEWWGRNQTINQRLRAFTSHTLDHYQHLLRLLQARGRMLSEAELLLIDAHESLAQFEALVLALDDDAFEAAGPAEGDWSARQVLEHVIENERLYRENIVAGLNGAAPVPTPTIGGAGG